MTPTDRRPAMLPGFITAGKALEAAAGVDPRAVVGCVTALVGVVA